MRSLCNSIATPRHRSMSLSFILYHTTSHIPHHYSLTTHTHTLLRSASCPPHPLTGNHRPHRFQGLSVSSITLDNVRKPHVLPLILSPGPETPSSVIPVLSEPPSPATNPLAKAVLCMNSRSRVGQSSKALINVHSNHHPCALDRTLPRGCLEPHPPFLADPSKSATFPCIDASAYRLSVASHPLQISLSPSRTLFHVLSGTARVLLGCRYDHIRTSQRGPRPNGLLY